jgi:hypothetical protein
MTSLGALQNHALARELALPATAAALGRELRNALIQASNTGALRSSPAEIFQLIQVLAEPPPMVAEQLRERKLLRDAYCIVGGEKNQRRDPGLAHFVRDDGAWFDFSITVRQRAALELLAYNFEIRFPSAMGSPFLRFDLNLPEHRNEHRELRSHLHVGSDDLYVPAPMMSPAELLGLLAHELRRPADRETWRAPTRFEIAWFLSTHEELASRGARTSGT